MPKVTTKYMFDDNTSQITLNELIKTFEIFFNVIHIKKMRKLNCKILTLTEPLLKISANRLVILKINIRLATFSKLIYN